MYRRSKAKKPRNDKTIFENFKLPLLVVIGDCIATYFSIKTDRNGDFLNAAGAVITGTGFNISIKDGSNNPVDKKFTFQAVGYGKGV